MSLGALLNPLGHQVYITKNWALGSCSQRVTETSLTLVQHKMVSDYSIVGFNVISSHVCLLMISLEVQDHGWTLTHFPSGFTQMKASHETQGQKRPR